MSTKIDWADEVWNPTVGCENVSLGCANCYAEKWAARLAAMGQDVYGDVINEHGRWNHRVVALPERLDIPRRWKKPRRIFVDSMSDLFHKGMYGEFIKRVLNVMWATPQHTYMVLTKRPERLQWFFGYNNKIPNLWIGVSVENQATADERIPLLVKTPAAVRFVSCEPLLGPVDLSAWMPGEDRDGIDWVIAGCESGPGARPAHKEWFRSLAHQTGEAYVPFFLKQMVVDGKIVKMPRLDGVLWDEFPNRCEHQGCRRMDAQEYLLRGEDEDIISNLCAEHARAEGYCLSCHEWFTEETWETGVCRECTEQFNGGDEDDDPEAEYPYDWDEPVVPPDDGRLLPDSIVEQGPAEE